MRTAQLPFLETLTDTRDATAASLLGLVAWQKDVKSREMQGMYFAGIRHGGKSHLEMEVPMEKTGNIMYNWGDSLQEVQLLCMDIFLFVVPCTG